MPYIVPATPPTPGWGDYLGQGFASGSEKGIDFLLKAILEGQLSKQSQYNVAPVGVPQQGATPGMGFQNLPVGGGRTFSGTPQAAQRLIPGYIKGLQSQVNQGTMPTTNLPPGFAATPTGKSALRYLPLTRSLEEAKLKGVEAETALKTGQANWWKNLGNGNAAATGAVFDSTSGGIRPVLPGEEPQFLITPTKSGNTVTSLAPTNKINAEMAAEKQKQEESSIFVRESASDALDTITKIETRIQHFGTFGQFPSIPGTERTIWESNVNKLLSGKVLQVMDAMKKASKAGGTGFGQLSNKELVVLQEASTALKKQLPPGEAQNILNIMKEKLNKISQNGDSSSPLAGGTNGTVTMQDRNGKTYQIPANRVQEATTDGLQPVGR